MSNEIYKKILKKYEQTRSRREIELNERTQAIYESIPEIKDADVAISKLGIKAALHVLQTGEDLDVADSMEEMRLVKMSHLINNGYPSDYLEMEYDCYLCNDTGYLEDASMCSCFKQKLAVEYYVMSNLDAVLKRENFETFDINIFSDDEYPRESISPRENMKEIYEESKNFVLNFEDETYNLLFYGGTGLGKTFMSNCIAKALLDRGYTVVYQTAYNILDILEKYRFRKDETALSKERYDYIFEADLLIIDDLGTELSNSFTNAEIFNIVNSRSISGKKTIISTNLTPKEISETYTDRVFSRILDKFIPFRFFGPDLRWQ